MYATIAVLLAITRRALAWLACACERAARRAGRGEDMLRAGVVPHDGRATYRRARVSGSSRGHARALAQSHARDLRAARARTSCPGCATCAVVVLARVRS